MLRSENVSPLRAQGSFYWLDAPSARRHSMIGAKRWGFRRPPSGSPRRRRCRPSPGSSRVPSTTRTCGGSRAGNSSSQPSASADPSSKPCWLDQARRFSSWRGSDGSDPRSQLPGLAGVRLIGAASSRLLSAEPLALSMQCKHLNLGARYPGRAAPDGSGEGRMPRRGRPGNGSPASSGRWRETNCEALASAVGIA